MWFSKLQADFLGVASSALCMVHCAVMPLVVVVAGWANLDYFFVFMSLIAVFWATRTITDSKKKMLFWLSWLIFAIGLMGENIGIGFLGYIGSVGLIVLHFLNIRKIYA